ncbi:MAG: hypothetical protein MUC97_16495 [Bernardetiaceae bacterium]|jgi:TolB-like protein|nr:hypothetical protein [Bernardetiaceae bacterium]
MKKTILVSLLLSLATAALAQPKAPARPTIGVLYADVQGLGLTNELAGNLLRSELEKLDTLEVIDKYDLFYLLGKANLDPANCFGKQCLIEAGRALQAQFMLMGSVERYSERITIGLRLYRVETGTLEKQVVKEFLDLPDQLPLLWRVSLHELFGRRPEEFLVKQLTVQTTQETYLNNPASPLVKRLRTDGPRMGFTMVTGQTAARLREAEATGGFNVLPVMFQFGYQFEQQYLNEGNFQALFEFIPMLTGMDQNLFIPSFTILNGLRNNKNGWEIAFGPTVRMVLEAEDYYNPAGQWTLRSNTSPLDAPFIRRLDSRGEATVNTGFVIAFGKTFRSGRLNLPLNGYVVPHREGVQCGLSFGFNAKKG